MTITDEQLTRWREQVGSDECSRVALALLDEVELLRAFIRQEEAWNNDLTVERDQLRAELERIRPVYEAAKKWHLGEDFDDEDTFLPCSRNQGSPRERGEGVAMTYAWLSDGGFTFKISNREYDVVIERRSTEDLSIYPPRYRATLIQSVSGGHDMRLVASMSLAAHLEDIARCIREEATKES